jgi:hypothetical protein
MGLIRSWPHSGFTVYVGGAVSPDDKTTLARIARYMLRAPVVLARLAYDRTPPGSAGCRAAETRHLHARPISPTAMKANGREAGAYDGRSSSGRSGRRIRSSVPAAEGPCESSRSSPMELLSTRYSGTSGTSTPICRLRAIILHLSLADCRSGKPGPPRTWPRCSSAAARSAFDRGDRCPLHAFPLAQCPMISPEKRAPDRRRRATIRAGAAYFS